MSPNLRLDHVHHAQHGPRRDVGNGQLIADQEIALARFDEGVDGLDGAVHFPQLPRHPFLRLQRPRATSRRRRDPDITPCQHSPIAVPQEVKPPKPPPPFPLN